MSAPPRIIASFALAVLAIALAAAGCGVAPQGRPTAAGTAPYLNSDRIRERFGSYGIEVVRQDRHLRVSNLYSIEGGHKVTRTVAVVRFPDDVPAEIQAEHREIRRGQSIGETFRRRGWAVRKQTLYTGTIAASSSFAGVYAAMGGIAPVGLAVHVYNLSVARDRNVFPYVAIAEVHHPDYLRLPELEGIYGEGEADALAIEGILEAAEQAMAAFRAAPARAEWAAAMDACRYTAFDSPILN